MRAQKSNRRRILAALAAAGLVAAPLGAQSSQPQAPQPQAVPVNPRQGPAPPRTTKPVPGGKATIRSTVSLVEIDVQVINRDGKPVKGLTQDQFSVTEDGKPQKISTFEYNDIERVETAGKGEEAPLTVPLGTVTSPEEIKSVVRDHRMIVMFFDLTSLQAEDLLRSTRAAQKYLQDQMTPADLVAIVAFGNTLKIVANFTNDRELLKQSVDALVPGHEAALAQLADAATAANGETLVSEDTGAAFTADDTEFNIFNTDRKLAAVEALCEVLQSFKQQVGKGTLVTWPVGVSVLTDEGVASNMKTTPNSIGYMELSYAIKAQLNYASILNHDLNNYVLPSSATAQVAEEQLPTALPNGEGDWSSIALLNVPGTNAYPLVTFTYVIVYRELSILSSMDLASARGLVGFLWYLVHDAQSLGPPLGYVPLPPNVVHIDEVSLESMTFQGQALT